MTNVDVTPKRAAPLGGAGSDGSRLVYATAAKAAQSDTVTLQNVKQILWVSANVTDGTNTTVDTATLTDASNAMVLSGSTTGTARILALVK